MLALIFALAALPNGQAAVSASPAEILQRILVRQEELNSEWKKYDFVEEAKSEVNPPPTKKDQPTSWKWEIHNVGNYGLARLVATDGKPLSAERQKKEDRREQKYARRLQENPDIATEHSDAVPSAVASFFLRSVRAQAATIDSNGDLLLTVSATDSEEWTRYHGYSKPQRLSGTIRADSATYSIKDFSVSDATADSSQGGLARRASGTTFRYVQENKDGHEFPASYEESGQYRMAFGAQRTYHTTIKFSDFRAAATQNAKSPAR